jgi:hypothetical protein
MMAQFFLGSVSPHQRAFQFKNPDLRNALRKSKVAQFLSKNAPILIF